jgi:pimeloyl-ACP methyl ester carboxylesterase
MSGVCFAQTHPYRDFPHDSKVFGQSKIYRIYLPKSYHQSTQHYPVIYFFHGWGGRYYKDDSAKLEYDLLGTLVDKYQVILVMWDGNMDASEPRPYNVGNHEDVKFQVQMKDYFPELVGYIDSEYRTIANRNHRGIIGFSMGGFMSAFIAGKYPDMVSAITDMVGSPEFFVGYPSNHTLYPLRYTFNNLKDVAFRLHNMDNCPLVYMNTEVINAAEWDGLANFEYWIGEGDHKVDEPGETQIFEASVRFIINRFNHPITPQKSWSHFDIYPDFSVWGYSVKSDKDEPGFLYLRNVTQAGFGFYTRKWLPDGPVIKNCTANVTTAPVYKKGSTYDIMLYNQESECPVLIKQKADQEGRLHFGLTGDGYEVSITHKSQPADFVVLSYQLDSDKRYIRINENNSLNLTLLNRGGDNYANKKILLTVTCSDQSVELSNAMQELLL